ncbi:MULTISPECIES: Tat pathway signal protein [Streptomyces]|uniref:Tat pathway signal protein n=1 Tax=Streptomyces morookaense TaxID=1970 RepID=A0A7Y7B062_STRMO|nr:MULTISPECIES: Tat pathway signal protein [Streptomyces]MCC2274311.1 hypothetical protein [Streptomyces sp. ET3-23]NVK76613.1 Tat pathway signal protein [Streptomyces morookaense]GHF08393.1 hypothetical protein GCM10010359_07030 [Streptomyces morookaense]
MVPLPRPVIDAMAERAMRMHHMLWHVSRNEWADLTPAQQQEFRAHGWDPPRPALTGGADSRPELDNGSGEDFLYMHRQMIADVDAILARAADPGYPRVEGWSSIPAPGDTAYPVPPPFDVPGDPDTTRAVEDAKSTASFDRIRRWQAEYTDPSALRGMTLGQLGARIEFTIHNRMHLRWSARLPAYRPDGDPFDVDPRWDAPGYDWLADFYSSHVNPVFWKLHGWVDARIDGWMTANHRTGPVPWSFDPPWTGPMMHADALEETVEGLKRTNLRVRTPFFRSFDLQD